MAHPYNPPAKRLLKFPFGFNALSRSWCVRVNHYISLTRRHTTVHPYNPLAKRLLTLRLGLMAYDGL